MKYPRTGGSTFLNMKHTPPEADAELPQLDFVRAAAVLLVFFAHLIHTLGYQHLGSAAHFGVLLFFVHTCLVLFMALERLSRTGPTATRFYVRRAFRIYPLSILAVVVVLTFHIPANTWSENVYVPPGTNTILANILLVQNVTGDPSILSPLWSLPFEVQMYLALPLLFILYKRYSVGAYSIWLAALVAAAVLSLWPAYARLLLFAPCFCSGIVAYDLIRKMPPWSFQTLAISLAILLVSFVSVARFTPLLVTDSIGSIIAGVVIGRSGAPSSAIVRLASHVIAKYSYGIYLAHLPLMWICFRHGAHLSAFVLFAITMLIVPFVLYHGVESPMIQLGRRISSYAPRMQAASAANSL